MRAWLSGTNEVKLHYALHLRTPSHGYLLLSSLYTTYIRGI